MYANAVKVTFVTSAFQTNNKTKLNLCKTYKKAFKNGFRDEKYVKKT